MDNNTTVRNNFGGGSRTSNLELLRIIMMLSIIAHHYVVNSGLTAPDGPLWLDPLSVKSICMFIIGAWGKTGINVFVLITGYFMCKSYITLKKFVKLLGEMMFYRIIILLIFQLSGYHNYSISEIAKCLIPVYSVSTDFSQTYLLFYLCIPFLSILVRNIDEKQHILLLLLCTVIYIIPGTIPGFNVKMNYVSWFIVLFFIGSYIRLFPHDIFQNRRFCTRIFLISFVLAVVSIPCCIFVSAKINKSAAYYFVQDSNTILAVLLGISLFLLFKNLPVRHSAFVNTLAASTFGILMIHANSDVMRQWLWHDTLKNVYFFQTDYWFLHVILSVAAIYFVCFIIDYFRIRLIEKPFYNLWDRKFKYLEENFLSLIKI